jgi:hypothetical protein
VLGQGNYTDLAHVLGYFNTGGGNGAYIEENGFPSNFIKASPQFNSATFYDNQGSNNYHSFQAQITLRPTYGVYFQSTYTWSKNMGNSGGISPDPRDMSTGYVLLSGDRPHNWVTYGNYQLPFGPGKLVGTDTTGVLAKFIEGWQVGWITNVTSGAPLNMSAYCGMYANCTPVEVNGGIDPSAMDFSWPDGARYGQHLFGGTRYTIVDDPQCSDLSILDPSLQGFCNYNAIYDNVAEQIVLQNPLPGQRGTMAYNKYRDLTRWNVDMSFSKGVTVREGLDFRFRIDVANVFNHPRPTAPAMNINSSTPLGQVGSKTGNRTLQAMLRIDF